MKLTQSRGVLGRDYLSGRGRLGGGGRCQHGSGWRVGRRGSVRKSKIVEIATIFEGRDSGRETDFLYSETDLVQSGHGM